MRAGLPVKAACVFMVSQTPAEIRPKLKEWIRSKEGDLAEDAALQFGMVLRKALAEKGIPTDHGCRVQHVREFSPSSELGESGERSNDSSEPETIKVQQISRESRKREPKGKPGRLQCYCCGSRDHLFRFCPNKRCSMCGRSGHKPADCPQKGVRTGDQKESRTNDRNRVFLFLAATKKL